MYQKVMVPLDGSELAECVLPHVESIAKGGQVKSVVFVRVVQPLYLLSAWDGYALSGKEVQRIEEGQLAAARDYLRQLVAKIKYDGVNIGYNAIWGNVVDSLVDYAEKNNVDLIVIATHGRSGISRWAWGSVADRILRSARMPVLMVRAPGCVRGI
jgi:nucleotide-binding universal stress UspA family protein